jgi:hypothetical protein
MYNFSLIAVNALSLIVARVSENVQTADLKIASSLLQDDLVERMHFLEAARSVWGSTGSEKVKDLVLHDAGVVANASTPDFHTAMSVLMLRRKIATNSPESIQTEAGLAALLSAIYPSIDIKIGRPPSYPPKELSIAELYAPQGPVAAPSKTIADPQSSDFITSHSQFWEWQRTLSGLENFPLVLQTAILLDAWNQAALVEQMPHLGVQLIASHMRRQGGQGRLRALNIGLVLISRDRWASTDPTTRLIGLLRGIEQASQAEVREHDRLKAKLDELFSKISEPRYSKFRKLVQLCRRRPIITVRTVSKELRVSAPTARSLISELGLREITGKKSGRVWSLT